MFFIIFCQLFAFVFGLVANLEDHRKASRLGKQAFDEPELGDVCV
jgi:hypothetical protein